MVNILVRGGDAERAANEMALALQEIFEIEPVRSASRARTRATRGLAEAALIVLAIPPGVAYAKKLAQESGLGDGLRRLVTRADAQKKSTGARLLIDIGDGKPIPLLEANREKILEALAALENPPKNK